MTLITSKPVRFHRSVGDTRVAWPTQQASGVAGEAQGRKILIATDAWRPQVNGVVRTLSGLAQEVPQFGAQIRFLTPEGFSTLGMPGYPEIRLALASPTAIAQRIEQEAPEAIHIATEGPIGVMVRHWCLRNRVPFTTCYHTRYPEYVAARWPVPLGMSYGVMRHFHNAAAATMAATQGLMDDLSSHGFDRLVLWQRGVDTELFSGGRPGALDHLPKPIFLCVARVAVEKNIDAFLALDLPGSKVVVGDGPARAELQQRFPDAHFLGIKHGLELADIYASADVFVFPSRTDTFGLVMLEAMSAGLPVAAFPVTGPLEIIRDPNCGIMNNDLRAAALQALGLSKNACRAYASGFTLAESARSFLNNISTSLRLRPFEAL